MGMCWLDRAKTHGFGVAPEKLQCLGKGSIDVEELVSRFGSYSTDVLAALDLFFLNSRAQEFLALFQQVIRGFGRIPKEHARSCECD
jgi:hypothetical protein